MVDTPIGIWMPIHIGDTLAETMPLSNTELGGYLRLLMHCWKNGGYVPNEIKTLKNITRLSEEKLASVMRFFIRTELGVCHPRFKAEYDKALENHRKRQQQTEPARKARLSATASVTENVSTGGS